MQNSIFTLQERRRKREMELDKSMRYFLKFDPRIVKLQRFSASKFLNTSEELQLIYKELNCKLIECPDIQIGGQWFSLILDEEGRLLEGNLLSALVNGDQRTNFIGTLGITKYNDAGHNIGLTEEDILHIKQYVTYFKYIYHDHILTALNFQTKPHKTKTISGAFNV